MTDYFARMRQLIGTTAEWAANDLVIGLGEFAVEIAGPLHNRLKMGDGINRYSALPYYDPGINQFVQIAGDTMTGPLTVPELDVTGPATFTGPVSLGTQATVAEPPSLADADTSVPTTHWVQQQIGGVVSGLHLKGTWNAATNDPTLQNGGAGTPPNVRGDFYLVSVTGTTPLDGISTWAAGDSCVFNGVAWQRVPQTLNYEQIVGGLGYVPANDADAIKRQIVDAAGDLIMATGPDTVARLARGTTGQVLASTAGGIAWAPAAASENLYSETILSAQTASIIVAIPQTWRSLRISFYVFNVGSVGASLCLCGQLGATAVQPATYSTQQMLAYDSSVAAQKFVNANRWQFNGTQDCWGDIRIHRGRNASTVLNMQASYTGWIGTTYQTHSVGGQGCPVPPAIDGFQLFNASNEKFDVGSYARVFVVA